MGQLFLGDGFFSRYYTYFDLQTKRVGLAKNKQVIPLSKLIENKLDANPNDWKNILKNLNGTPTAAAPIRPKNISNIAAPSQLPKIIIVKIPPKSAFNNTAPPAKDRDVFSDIL